MADKDFDFNTDNFQTGFPTGNTPISNPAPQLATDSVAPVIESSQAQAPVASTSAQNSPSTSIPAAAAAVQNSIANAAKPTIDPMATLDSFTARANSNPAPTPQSSLSTPASVQSPIQQPEPVIPSVNQDENRTTFTPDFNYGFSDDNTYVVDNQPVPTPAQQYSEPQYSQPQQNTNQFEPKVNYYEEQPEVAEQTGYYNPQENYDLQQPQFESGNYNQPANNAYGNEDFQPYQEEPIQYDQPNEPKKRKLSDLVGRGTLIGMVVAALAVLAIIPAMGAMFGSPENESAISGSTVKVSSSKSSSSSSSSSSMSSSSSAEDSSSSSSTEDSSSTTTTTDTADTTDSTSTDTTTTTTTTYTVVSGDTWYSIARNNNMTVDQLYALNGATANSPLIIGQTVQVG
ncbi:MAG: LysM peptidoglycan-binding domain-containing protein [Lactobacillaceae bacterium]|jgi:LysM repeat protein|nr:LysM peptidoglycan-binding domain-containing protein [Lactobacillaceae bacterium]